MDTIGQRITAYRKAIGLTQIQLGEILHISQPVVAYYENGKRNVPVELLIPLAEALQISANDLLGTTEYSQSKNKFEQRLEKISSLSRRKQERILSVIDTLLADASR